MADATAPIAAAGGSIAAMATLESGPGELFVFCCVEDDINAAPAVDGSNRL